MFLTHRPSGIARINTAKELKFTIHYTISKHNRKEDTKIRHLIFLISD